MVVSSAIRLMARSGYSPHCSYLFFPHSVTESTWVNATNLNINLFPIHYHKMSTKFNYCENVFLGSNLLLAFVS